MNITITDAALKELDEIDIPSGYGLRIDAEMTGG